jgi:hypothetical protein
VLDETVPRHARYVHNTGCPIFFTYFSYDPEGLVESALDIVKGDPVDVKAWSSTEQARYVKERVWSKSQKIEN